MLEDPVGCSATGSGGCCFVGEFSDALASLIELFGLFEPCDELIRHVLDVGFRVAVGDKFREEFGVGHEVGEGDIAAEHQKAGEEASDGGDAIEHDSGRSASEEFEADGAADHQAAIGCGDDFGGGIDEVIQFQFRCVFSLECFAALLLLIAIAANDPADVGDFAGDAADDFEHYGPVFFDFVISRTGQYGDDGGRGVRAKLAEYFGLQRAFLYLIEEGMSDPGTGDATCFVPVVFEGESAEHMIDPAADFANAPGGPRPELGGQVIEHRDSAAFGSAGDPPVKAGEIDQDDSIGPLSVHVPLCQLHKTMELADQRDDAEEAHDGEFCEFEEKLAAGIAHFRAAESLDFDFRGGCLELFDEPRAVLITAGFTGRKENPHDLPIAKKLASAGAGRSQLILTGRPAEV